VPRGRRPARPGRVQHRGRPASARAGGGRWNGRQVVPARARALHVVPHARAEAGPDRRPGGSRRKGAMARRAGAAGRAARLVALGVRTHEPQHRQARLRAAVDEAHHLHARHALDDHLGQHVLQRARRAERGALRAARHAEPRRGRVARRAGGPARPRPRRARAGRPAEQPAVLRCRRRVRQWAVPAGGQAAHWVSRAKEAKAAWARVRRIGRRAGARLVDLLLQRLGHLRVRVADDGRAPAAHVVDVLARARRRRSVNQARLQSLCRAVRVPQRCLQATSTLPRPGGALAGKTPRMGPPAGAPHLVAVHVEAVGPADVVKDDGLPADRLERAHRRVNAARQQRQRLLEHLRALAPVAAATPVAPSSSPRELGRRRATRLTGRRDARQASMRAGPSTRLLGREPGARLLGPGRVQLRLCGRGRRRHGLGDHAGPGLRALRQRAGRHGRAPEARVCDHVAVCRTTCASRAGMVMRCSE